MRRYVSAMGFVDRVLDASVVASFDRSGFERHARHFDAAEVDVDMTGKVCVVTGANGGLGLATTLALAERGATVVMACRNVERGRAARATVVAATGNDSLYVHALDLSHLESVRSFVAELPYERIDVVVHNAGLLPSAREFNDAGLELTVAVHVVGPHALTAALRARVRGGRIIWVSSGGMYTKRLDVDAMLDATGEYDGVAAYAMTKRAQVVLAQQWADQLRGEGTVVHAMHPGWAATAGVQTSLPRFWKAMEHRLRTPVQGADTIVWLAVSDRAARSSGQFWFDRAVAPTHRLPWTRDRPQARARLWEFASAAVDVAAASPG